MDTVIGVLPRMVLPSVTFAPRGAESMLSEKVDNSGLASRAFRWTATEVEPRTGVSCASLRGQLNANATRPTVDARSRPNTTRRRFLRAPLSSGITDDACD